MYNRNIRERKHRLPLEFYKGNRKITFTLCIAGKKDIFTNKSVVDKFLEILKHAEDKYDCRNWVYIFMPNHSHIILEGKSEESDLYKTITLFKQRTGFWLTQNTTNVQWQKDFYDYIHRKENDFKRHIMYVLNNPVRKGLVSNWQDYFLKGSLDFNLEEIIR